MGRALQIALQPVAKVPVPGRGAAGGAVRESHRLADDRSGRRKGKGRVGQDCTRHRKSEAHRMTAKRIGDCEADGEGPRSGIGMAGVLERTRSAVTEIPGPGRGRASGCIRKHDVLADNRRNRGIVKRSGWPSRCPDYPGIIHLTVLSLDSLIRWQPCPHVLGGDMVWFNGYPEMPRTAYDGP